MTTNHYKRAVLGQFQASLAMLEECIRACPAKHWKGIIGKYPFWQVAYHTLCFVDLYSARSTEVWKPHPKFHPKGMDELRLENPSRAFSKKEVLAYLEFCKRCMRASLKRETATTLKGPSGFEWLKMPRAEMPLYNMRHVQHHTGQLSAYLRRAKVKTRWVRSGDGAAKTATRAS